MHAWHITLLYQLERCAEAAETSALRLAHSEDYQPVAWALGQHKLDRLAWQRQCCYKRECTHEEAQCWWPEPRPFSTLLGQRNFIVGEQPLHQHHYIIEVKVSQGVLSPPGRRLEAGCPGLSAPVHPHVVDSREDKGCKAIAKSAHDCIDCVCSQTVYADSVSLSQAYIDSTEGVHAHFEMHSGFYVNGCWRLDNQDSVTGV